MIAYAKLKDREKFIEWCRNEGWKRSSNPFHSISDGGWWNNHWHDYGYTHQGVKEIREAINIFEYDSCAHRESGHRVEESRRYTDEFFALIDRIEAENQKLKVFYHDEICTVVGYGKHKYIMPTEWLDFEELKNYGDLTLNDIKAISGPQGVNLPAELNSESVSSLTNKKEKQKEALKALKKEIEDVEKEKSEELAEIKKQMEALQAEMEKKKQSLLAELNLKREEMEAIQKDMEKKIYMMESQIYGIRCYLGEVIELKQITAGKNAPDDSEIIIYQKIRYLDVELGKYMSLYDFGIYEDDKESLVKILANRKDLRDIFVPAERSVCVLKMSQSGTVIGQSNRFENVIETYKHDHGSQLAFLIRNGGNTYITWLDEEKIILSDSNTFFKPENTKLEKIDEEKVQNGSTQSDMISRYFIASFLQGLMDNSKILPVPEDGKHNLMNKYVSISLAEGWLKDTRYGSFDNMLQKSYDIKLKEGDMVLTGLCVTRDDAYSSRFQRWSNDRGIGSANRTHDAHIPANKILPINKILYEVFLKVKHHREYTTFKINFDDDGKNKSEILKSWGEDPASRECIELIDREYSVIKDKSESTIGKITEDEWREIISKKYYYLNDWQYELKSMDNQKSLTQGNNAYLYNYNNGEEVTLYKTVVDNITIDHLEPHYYISAEKEANWETGKVARANMEVMEDEILPVTFLCSSWIKYVITTENLGGFTIGGSYIPFASALKYLNTILEYLKEQEEEIKTDLEAAGLSKWIKETPDWDVMITEYRIKNKIHKLTPRSIHAFVKDINYRKRGLYE